MEWSGKNNLIAIKLAKASKKYSSMSVSSVITEYFIVTGNISLEKNEGFSQDSVPAVNWGGFFTDKIQK